MGYWCLHCKCIGAGNLIKLDCIRLRRVTGPSYLYLVCEQLKRMKNHKYISLIPNFCYFHTVKYKSKWIQLWSRRGREPVFNILDPDQDENPRGPGFRGRNSWLYFFRTQRINKDFETGPPYIFIKTISWYSFLNYNFSAFR